MKDKLYKIMIPLFLLVFLAGCGSTQDAEKTDNKVDKRVAVVASFNAMAELTKAIGGDKIELTTIVPSGVEAHDFEPKPRDIASLSKASLFIYNGLGMEPWAKDMLKSIDNKNLEIIEAFKEADLIKNSGEEIGEHGEFDPHVWLSLKEAKVQANSIKEGLIKVDSNNKDYYESNYKEFSKKIDDLKAEYEKKITSLERKDLVTGHAAFAYLCRDFGIQQHSVEDVFAEGEPTSQKIKELIDLSKKIKIKTVFMEENASPKVSETIAKEVGAKVDTINTLESEGDYINTMKENLEKIYNSLT
ncbi:metal ABC transporter solute-binding protein, Zn/Mn family [Clostridium amazonitimonense]|uniref:metal ABC transporter solute-binding protein, Zn/Mn family n=1 Tax=Clostridium amazonitimonense TaxID=1499689 RepID=UPI0005095110|nr:zinc ABC transporter substrate-binding protein [Clostridium amazonitimonense]